MASNTDAFGGSGWQQMLADLMKGVLSGQIDLGNLLGTYTKPAYTPTESETLLAIYNNRPDLQAAFKKANKNKTPDEAKQLQMMRDWTKTGEGANLVKQPGGLVAYAQSQKDLAGNPWLRASTPETKTPTLGQQNQDWAKLSGQQGLALDYAKTLASMSGPADYGKSWLLQQNAAKTQIPAWGKILQNMTGIQGNNPASQGLIQRAFGGQQPAGNQQQGAYFDAQGKWQQPNNGMMYAQGAPSGNMAGGQQGNAANAATGGGQNWQQLAQALQAQFSQNQLGSNVLQKGTTLNGAQSGFGTQQQQAPAWTPSLRPQDVTAQGWNALSPSAQQGMMGIIGSLTGQDPNDWLKQMQQLSPIGQATGRTQWGF
jgi:hypothetical protein